MSDVDAFHQAYKERLRVDCRERTGSFVPHWAGLGFDRFHDILLPEVAPVWECLGRSPVFRWVRGHGIFREDELNRPDWGAFKDQKRCLDTILGAGLRPILEISVIPAAFRNPDHPLGFCGDVQGWNEFVKAFIAFLLDAYGSEAVSQWYFEFWNEPDHLVWAIDQQKLDWGGITSNRQIEAYCTMYDWTVSAIKDVHRSLMVGGPALTGDTVFLREFMAHCLEGTNAATGKRGVPLDFVSFHVYSNSPDRFPCMQNILGRLLEVCRLVDRYARNRPVRKILSEWGMTWGGWKHYPDFPLEYRNSQQAAVFTLKLVKETLDLDLSAMVYWGFSEWTWNKRSDRHGDFNGWRALFNFSGIERPVMGAYRLLARLANGSRCQVHRMVDTNNVDALCAIQGRAVHVVLWNHDTDPYQRLYPSASGLVIENLPESLGEARLKLEGYTTEHNTYAAWCRMGCPTIPTPEQVERIQSCASPRLMREETVRIQDHVFATGDIAIRPGECFALSLEW